MKKYFFSTLSLIALLFTGCAPYSGGDESQGLASINIIDRNGLTETVSSKERLKRYQLVDFLAPQPFEKVLRIYGRDPKGGIRSVVTSYYPNGQVKQYLEAYNGRANGLYKEWHENGFQSLEVQVVGGAADLFAGVENTWVFDGIGRAWDEEGNLSAEIPYHKGQLVGEARHYHPNGSVAKAIPHINGKVEGILRGFSTEGYLTESAEYQGGLRHGASARFWNETLRAAEETYSEGFLLSGKYWDRDQNVVGGVEGGNGSKAIFKEWGLAELQQVKRGRLEGFVKVFNPKGSLIREYHVLGGVRHGEEVEYFVDGFSSNLVPKLSVNWFEGGLQGLARTWYPSGQLESQREMSRNRKQGTGTAWYEDGSLMLVEEYDNDRLVKGKYLRKGERLPVSQVEEGKGIAILFDSSGNFLKKIAYQDGVPVE